MAKLVFLPPLILLDIEYTNDAQHDDTEADEVPLQATLFTVVLIVYDHHILSLSSFACSFILFDFFKYSSFFL
ncbi:hypothetical protein G4V62_00385 [Bacillaceae bacterium SIJ1]|uniref:hypothetical protein n=1 Tax=Litoribacterium kuwaitense TaxID=1398745 RepID=UPI0013EB1816|nr:hypothetical protein [Litoribacterium kuwaitense]NGP43495.1 hypothetical protein [Litoribacterium kuwaitense]